MTATVHTARKARPCGEYRCPNTINPGDQYVRHVTFPGQDGYEYGTQPRVLEQCPACVDRHLRYFADRYRVPLRLGSRLLFRGEPHVVVGASGGSVLVRPADGGPAVPIHPMWQTEYLDLEVPA